MNDIETLDDLKKNKRDDFSQMITNAFSCLNFKVAGLLFIFGIFIFSDIFIEQILSKFSNSTSADTTTSKGTIIQLLFIIIFYLFIDLLNQGQLI